MSTQPPEESIMDNTSQPEPALNGGVLSRLRRLATRRTVLILLALELLFNIAVLPVAEARIKAGSGGVGPLDLMPGYSAAQAYSAISAYNEDGRVFYLLIELTVDLIYPIIYSLFFSLTILYFLRRNAAQRPGLARLALLPFGALICDWAENAGIVTMLLTYPAQQPVVGVVTGLLTSLKWIFAGLSLLAVVFAVGSAVMARLRRPPPTSP
jgi:hypothetical protein